MFKKSTLFVLMVVVLVFASSFTSQMVLSGQLPSAYDPGLTIDKAFQTAKTPLLVEFYSDTCSTCKRIAPWVHDAIDGQYKDKLTLVMLDMANPNTTPIAQLFGVDELPGVYVFDFKNMKKHAIASTAFASPESLTLAIDKTMANVVITGASAMRAGGKAPFASMAQ